MSTKDELSRLFDEARAVRPPEGVANAGLERLLQGLASQAAALPVAAGSLHLGWSIVFKWIGAGFALGLAGAGAAAYVSTPAAAPAVATASVSREPAPMPSTAAAVVAEAPAALPAPSVVDAVPLRAALDRATAAVPSSRPTFDEELQLITAAKRELDAGRSHLAQVWLTEHRQRFPSGVFSLERDALVIRVRCSQSKNPDLARDFGRQHPGAPMLAQLQRSCGAESTPANERRGPHEDFSDPTNAPKAPGEPMNE